jgi:uncharacterized membrane protein
VEGLIILAVIFLVVMPIVSVIMISGVGSRVSDLENAITDLKNKIASLDGTIRNSGVESMDSRDAGPSESPAPQHGLGEPAKEEAISSESRETLEPSPQAAATPEIPQIPEEIEHHEEKTYETPVPPPFPYSAPETAETGVPADTDAAAVEHSWFAKRWRALISWLLSEGNIWVTVGVMLFLAGFGLLFSYVHRRGWIPLELRLTGAAVVGIAMTAFGWRLRESRRTYALILQGGGIGVLYIVLIAGAKLGPVIPVAGAVLGMLLLSAFTVVMALYQEFEPLAIFALIGGYAAPILVSAGSQNFVALFSIHALLNFEAFMISLFRDWRKTRWGGLLASLATGVAWGALRWRASYFASVEPFLILFYINYSALALIPLFPDKLKDTFKNIRFWRYERMDAPMIAAVPFVLVFLQMAAAAHTRYWVAVTCLVVGALHLALGRVVMMSERARKIGCSPQLFLVCCMIFSNLAIPFTFKQASASAIWAVEAAFLVAFAVRKNRDDAFVCGLLLHAAAFIIYNYGPYLHLPAHIYGISLRPVGLLDWFDETSPFLLTGLIFAASALVSSRFMSGAPAYLTPAVRIRGREFKMPSPDSMAYFFAAYGAVWWTLSVWHAAFVTFDKSGVTAFSILCVGGAAGYALSLYPAWKVNGVFNTSSPPSLPGWDAARILALPALAVVFIGTALWTVPGVLWHIYGPKIPILHDLWNSYSPNWPAFAAMFALGALSYRSAAPTRMRLVTWGISLFSFVSYTGIVWRSWISDYDAYWGYLIAFLPLCAATALLTLRRFDRAVAMRAYLGSSRAALCVMMLLRLPTFVSFFSVTSIPSFYVPLLNTLELRQFLYLAAAAMLINSITNERARRIWLHYVLTFVTFLLLNNVAARSALRYFGELVSFGHMSRAPYFQGIIAILWGLASLACIFGSKRYGYRPLWFIGAGLLAIDILKLLMIDLRNSATIIRIFAFLLLGGFFLLIGWAAPLPPKSSISGGQDEAEV